MPGLVRPTTGSRPSTKYQQIKVLCLCQSCQEKSNGKGLRIFKYTARRHAQLFPTESHPLPIDSRYRTQPFGLPTPSRSAVPAAAPTAPTATATATATATTVAAAASIAADRAALDGSALVRPAERAAEPSGVLDGDGMQDDLYWDDDGTTGMLQDHLETGMDVITPEGVSSVVNADATGSLNLETRTHTADSGRLSLAIIPAELALPSFEFSLREPMPPPQEILENSDGYLFWRIIYLLVVWLHLTYHLPHRGCDLILRVLHLVFSLLHSIPLDSDHVLTLNSSFRRLHLEDRFLILPLCTTCGKVAPPDLPKDSICSRCSAALFSSSTTTSRNLEGRRSSADARPLLRLPYNPLTQQLTDLLNREGMEKTIDEWRTRERTDGIMRDIMDGEVWKTIPGPDGKPFFDNDPDRESKDELRIGITMGFDGFGYQQSRTAASYSSDVLSCSISNLPVQLKCLTRNLLLLCVFPGPKAPDWRQTQEILVYIVDDLIRLFRDGIQIKTPLYPEGRLVRVVLVAVCCDHPALCRMVGFADHNHEKRFCTKCTVPHTDLRTAGGLKDNYTHRSGEDHRNLSFKYRVAEEDEKNEIFQNHGVRYTELVRLPYFDAVRMTVIDPMHNMLLGIMRSQWHDSLVKTDSLRKRTEPSHVPRELDLLNQYLKEFEMPSWVGRLPSDVGYPAAGSLSADEYKALVLVYLPIALSFVWEEWQPVARKEHEKKVVAWKKKEEAKRKRLSKGKTRKGDDEPSPEPVLRMHEEEAENVLNLSAALKVLLSRSILLADLPRARYFLERYLQTYLQIHTSDVKPNFHWVLHIFDQIRDYGPVYGFWSFTYERLNKLLKSYNTNNHGGGEVETSFMRAHIRDSRIRDLVLSAAQSEDDGLRNAGALLLQTDSDNRGTVAGLARELDEASQEAVKRFALGSGATRYLPNSLQKSLVDYYRSQASHANIYARTARIPSGLGHQVPNFLRDTAVYHKDVVLNGRRIAASADIYKAPNSIIQARIGTSKYVGQVHDILTHIQPPLVNPTVLLHVRWFKPLEPGTFNTVIWDERPELEVGFFEFGVFLDQITDGLPALISPSDIISQACRVRIVHRPERDEENEDEEDEDEDESTCTRIWATIGLTKDAITI